MYKSSARLLFLFGVAGFVCFGTTSPTVGFASARGTFEVDRVKVWGNATIFSGNTIQTNEAISKLLLKTGTQVWLAAASQATVFEGRTVLEKGIAQFAGSPGDQFEARTLKISAAQPDSLMRVELDASAKVVVATMKGAVQVRNSQGVLVAKVSAGESLTFDPNAAASNATSISGTVSRHGNAFMLQDETTHVSMQIQGNSLDRHVGRAVTIKGISEATPATVPGVSQVIRVQSVSPPAFDAPAASPHGTVVLMARAASPQAQAGGAATLNILIIEGDGAINNIRQRAAREPIVEVQDENHKPLSEVAVLFRSPDTGPGGTFANGAKTLEVMTDSQGRAVARGFQPNDIVGPFAITVIATYQGRTAQIVIKQSNVLGAVAAGAAAGAAAAGLSAGAKVAIIGGVAAAGTVGGLAAAGALPGQGESEQNLSR